MCHPLGGVVQHFLLPLVVDTLFPLYDLVLPLRVISDLFILILSIEPVVHTHDWLHLVLNCLRIEALENFPCPCAELAVHNLLI